MRGYGGCVGRWEGTLFCWVVSETTADVVATLDESWGSGDEESGDMEVEEALDGVNEGGKFSSDSDWLSVNPLRNISSKVSLSI